MGLPSETEIQDQWRAGVNVLEYTRALADNTVFGASSLEDVLSMALEGEYTPAGLSNAMAAYRAGLSSLIDTQRARSFLEPILAEYTRVINTTGVPYRNSEQIMRALWEHFVTGTKTIKSRQITFDTGTAGGSNVGNGFVTRLTVDEQNFPLEACHVEAKTLRCRQDARSGVSAWGEVFELVTQPASKDAIRYGTAQFGSGLGGNLQIVASHAGSARGGSLLRNSSFDLYAAGSSPKFTMWTEVAGGSKISQDTATTYRGFPGSGTAGSLKIDNSSAATTVTLRQPLTDWRVQSLNPNRPYLFRAMVNKGTMSAGNIVLRLGSKSVTVAHGALSAGWNEVLMTVGQDCWFRRFNTTDLNVEIEWSGGPAGICYIDDVILVPFDLIDGTYWNIRHKTASTPVPWKVDDTYTFTDTGGAAGTGKLQWWLWRAGLGYLPSTAGVPTVADPT